MRTAEAKDREWEWKSATQQCHLVARGCPCSCSVRLFPSSLVLPLFIPGPPFPSLPLPYLSVRISMHTSAPAQIPGLVAPEPLTERRRQEVKAEQV